MDSKIKFSHNGKEYEMTKEEIDAAYRYQERQYRLEDAERQALEFCFGTDPDNLIDEEAAEARSYFENKFGLSVEEVTSKQTLEAIVDRFFNISDCNVDENTTWQNAIYDVICDMR